MSTDQSTPASSIINQQTYDAIMRKGIPSGVASGLAISGLQRKPIVNGKVLVPSKLSAGVFGAAFGLGTFMMLDGDYKNGSGFTAVWSTLYLMANRNSFGKNFYASTLWGLAALNAVGYAIEFTKAEPAVPKQNIEPNVN